MQAAARALAYLFLICTDKAAAIILVAASCDGFDMLVVTVAADPARSKQDFSSGLLGDLAHPANASAHLAHIFPPNSLRKAHDIVPGTVAVDILQLHDGSRDRLKPGVKANLNLTGTVFVGDDLVVRLR